MKNFVQPGDVVTIPAPADVVSGAGVLAGALFGVASTDAVSGESLAVAVTGVFELPKVSAQAWTVGAAIYWIAAENVCTSVAGSNTLIGKAVAAAANPSATGVVRLNG